MPKWVQKSMTLTIILSSLIFIHLHNRANKENDNTPG